MKWKYLAWSLAVVLLLSACGEENDADNFEVEDPLLGGGGENDVGALTIKNFMTKGIISFLLDNQFL